MGEINYILWSFCLMPWSHFSIFGSLSIFDCLGGHGNTKGTIVWRVRPKIHLPGRVHSRSALISGPVPVFPIWDCLWRGKKISTPRSAIFTGPKKIAFVLGRLPFVIMWQGYWLDQKEINNLSSLWHKSRTRKLRERLSPPCQCLTFTPSPGSESQWPSLAPRGGFNLMTQDVFITRLFIVEIPLLVIVICGEFIEFKWGFLCNSSKISIQSCAALCKYRDPLVSRSIPDPQGQFNMQSSDFYCCFPDFFTVWV